MQRGSSKIAPRLDDDLKHDTEGLVRGGHDPRAEEWRGSEPSGEDQPIVGLRPGVPDGEGSAEGLSAAEVELRAELASYIGRAPYPVTREDVLALLAERNAPDTLVALVTTLPQGEPVNNLQDLWQKARAGS